jgi:hypothetical protein
MASAEPINNVPMPDAEQDTVESQAGQAGDKEERVRSSIQFPYMALDEAITIARGVHEAGDSNCQVDQVAAHLGQKSDNPKFRQKLGTTKMFGLITFAAGTVSLTPLGKRLNDPIQEQGAKVDSFLQIPLYNKLYDQFKGGTIPSTNSGLETAIANMGVSPKQKANARQAFQRSAEQAGFFWSGKDRLVKPIIKGSTGTPSDSPADILPPVIDISPGKKTGDRNGNGSGGGPVDPAIEGLIKRLPPPDSDWPLEKQVKWLLAVSHAFDVIYPRQDDERSLQIEIAKD